jgi:hypothetical protein
LALGERDPDCGDQYANHVIQRHFHYLTGPDRKEDMALGLHVHPAARGDVAYLMPHAHVYDSEVLGAGRVHLTIGRPCLEDLIEVLITELGVPVRRRRLVRMDEMEPEDQAMREALRTLQEGRDLFHGRFKNWHGTRRVDDLPESLQPAMAAAYPHLVSQERDVA